jgi:hypothetical protein
VLVQPPAVLVQPPAVLFEAGVVLLQAMEDLADLNLLFRLLLCQRREPETLFAHEAHEAFDLPGEIIETIGQGADLSLHPLETLSRVLDVPLKDGG